MKKSKEEGATKKRRYWTYGLDFKIEAVKRVGNGERATAVARELDISRSVLNRWRKQYRRVTAGKLRGPGRPRAEEGVPTALELAQRRIAELQRKVGEQAMEVDFLKKACTRVEGTGRRRRGGGSGSTKSSAR